MNVFGKYSEKFNKISNSIRKIKEDAESGEIKEPSSFASPILMKPNDFMLNETESVEPIDVFSFDKDMQKRRDNYYAYFQAVFLSFDSNYVEGRGYIKE